MDPRFSVQSVSTRGKLIAAEISTRNYATYPFLEEERGKVGSTEEQETPKKKSGLCNEQRSDG
jgi:hypothetical protein